MRNVNEDEAVSYGIPATFNLAVALFGMCVFAFGGHWYPALVMSVINSLIAWYLFRKARQCETST